jgi:predicted secreted hydrolase
LVRRRTVLALPLALACGIAHANGFPVVVAGRPPTFPRDHGSHPDYRTEWWYITGWLADRDAAELGVQVTFFRNRPNVAEASGSAFAPRQLVFAHAAIAEAAHGRLRHDQRAARAVFDLAGADERTTRAWIDDWSLALEGDRYACAIAARGFTLSLSFAATQPVMLQGDGGYSRKGPLPEHASHYYSRPQLQAKGRVEVDGRPRDVEGRAWLDHEWSSAYLAPGAAGWDWIGINLDDGGALMAFRIRDAQGGVVWAGGSLRTAQGRDERFAPAQVRFTPKRTWTSPRTSIAYPVEFDVAVGGNEYSIVPLMDDQELDSRVTVGTVYWEGAVRVSQRGRPVGRGYLELTGYGGRLNI